jgi:hypothetical protein
MTQKERTEKIYTQAIKFYHELQAVPIRLKFTRLSFSTMTARPPLYLFKMPWMRRRYIIFINSNNKFGKFTIPISELTDEILLGWLAHEIAHITQYEKMNWYKFIFFPVKYIFNNRFRREFENEADEITKQRGLEKELKDGINFTLNDQRVSTSYKARTKKYYSKI